MGNNNESHEDLMKELAKNEYDKAAQEQMVSKYKVDFAKYIGDIGEKTNLSIKPVKIKKSLKMRISESIDTFTKKLRKIFGYNAEN